MGYIGASDAEKIYPENTVDVITVLEGVSQYKLSQDVPGGYEANVLVVRNGEVLRPEAQYAIDWSPNDSMNNLITFLLPLVLNDRIFVIHKGVATYNLVPSPRSVTDDSLSENLRDFVYDDFVADGQLDRFRLSKREWQARSLVVTLNGAVLKPYIDVQHPDFDYSLEQVENDTATDIVFVLVPAQSAEINVLHLAFSTVLRRSDYLTEIVLGPNIIDTIHIKDNAVNGQKILLENNEPIRAKDTQAFQQQVIKLNASNEIEIYERVLLDNNALKPKISESIGLGTNSNKFKELYVSSDVHASGGTFTSDVDAENFDAAGDIHAGNDAHIDNNLYVGGTISFPGGNLDTVPIGFGGLWYTETPPVKYLVCNGQSIPQGQEYDQLRVLFPVGFLPDLTQKYPLGKRGVQSSTIGSAIGETGGSFVHNHSVVDHNHNLSSGEGGNVILSDSGHSHTAQGSLSVSIPSHCHFLNQHYHAGQSHLHSVRLWHKHTLNSQTDTDGSHTHAAPNNTGRYIASGGGDSAHINHTADGYSLHDYTGSNGSIHSHHVGGSTYTDGVGIPPNASYYNLSLINSDVTSAATAGISSGYYNGSSNVPDPAKAWNKTRFNRSDNLDPGVIDPQPAQSFSISGSTSVTSASISVSNGSYTANKTGLNTNNNVVNEVAKNNGPQPYYTVYFIIKAIP